MRIGLQPIRAQVPAAYQIGFGYPQGAGQGGDT
jgi:hypothetical protein